jgi:hypothetical protein
LSARDGTPYFSSATLHGPPCLTRQTSNGQTLYYHTAITPGIVCPGSSEGIALPPAYILPQDGQDKQDCERIAGNRWIGKHAEALAPPGVTLLGEELYSNQPLGEFALQHGCNFLCVCQPDAHATLYERVALWPANDGIKALERRHWNGRFTAGARDQYLNEVFLRGGHGA